MIYSPKLNREVWNDGPPLLDFMGREGAPTVAGKNLCQGGGGGSVSGPPNAPDYSNYVTAMTNVGNQLTGYGRDLYSWAKNAGVDLSNLAGSVSARAGQAADWATGMAQSTMAKWQQTYGALADTVSNRYQQFMGNLPATQEQWAGQYGAQTAQAFDASKASASRKLQGYGLSQPSIGTAAIDEATGNQRAAATVASANQGRMAAMQYGDSLATTTAGVLNPLASTGTTMANLGLGYGNQQVNAPESAISTTAGAYQPYLSSMSTGYPYMAQWGNTMLQGYNQTLQGYSSFNQAQAQANQQSSGWGALAGSIIGAGAKIGAAALVEKGGMIPNPEQAFVAAGHVVPSAVSPSGGRATDDVHLPILDGGHKAGDAAINVGEFIWPKDVVAWRGEQWMQKEIQKARKERESQTVAAPEMAPANDNPQQAFQPQARTA